MSAESCVQRLALPCLRRRFKFSGIVTTGTVVYLPLWVFVAEVVEHFAVRSFEANYADPSVMD